MVAHAVPVLQVGFRQGFERFPVQLTELTVRVHWLYADMGRAGVEVGLHPIRDGIDVAPGEGGVDELVRSPLSKSSSLKPMRSQLLR